MKGSGYKVQHQVKCFINVLFMFWGGALHSVAINHCSIVSYFNTRIVAFQEIKCIDFPLFNLYFCHGHLIKGRTSTVSSTDYTASSLKQLVDWCANAASPHNPPHAPYAGLAQLTLLSISPPPHPHYPPPPPLLMR